MFFYSEDMEYISSKKSNGYYHIQIRSFTLHRYFKTNNERAFVSLQLQQLLAARSVLEDPLYAKSLAHHIDLLAFSINEDGIQLLAYCIDVSSLQYLIDIILQRLSQYRSEYKLYLREPHSSVSIKKLIGEHEALSYSAAIHLLHQDWEYDRYSSIGFYLHDRRGDWMKLWRLSNLYNNDVSLYRKFMNNKVSLPDVHINTPLSPITSAT
jgi:hypothetical protein